VQVVGASVSDTVGKIAPFGKSEGCDQRSVTEDTRKTSYLGQPFALTDKRAKQQFLRS